MAGPAASVLCSGLSSLELKWHDIMSEIADSWYDGSLCHVSDSMKFGGSYRGEPRPFVGGVTALNGNCEYPVTSFELVAIHERCGEMFTHCIELAAMCNSPIDHRLLCEVARFLAIKHGGLVDFDGIITNQGPDDLLLVTWTEDGHDYSTQIGTPSVCDWWLEQPGFHMVK